MFIDASRLQKPLTLFTFRLNLQSAGHGEWVGSLKTNEANKSNILYLLVLCIFPHQKHPEVVAFGYFLPLLVVFVTPALVFSEFW